MKQLGISLLSSIACRELPSHKSQLVTQLLFGEIYEVITTEGEWVQILTSLDAYTCWIPSNQYQQLPNPVDYIVNKEIQSQIYINNLPFSIPLGALVPPLHQKWNIDNTIIENRSIENQKLDFNAENIEKMSQLLLRTPYLWGGRTSAGIDCSGFSQLIYRLFDKFIQRDAYQQAEEGNLISFLEESQTGDLAFFDNEEGRIIHVGIILQPHSIIHASGMVKIDQLDHEGIFNLKSHKYSHKLRVIKKI